MTMKTPCFVYTRDDVLSQRIQGYLGTRHSLLRIADAGELKTSIQQMGPALILLDLRGHNIRTLLPELIQDWPDSLIVAFGIPRSDPALQAAALGVYAMQPLDFEGTTLQSLARQALDHLQLAGELRLLRGQSAATTSQMDLPAAGPARAASRFALPPIRSFDNIDSLLQAIIDSVARNAMVLRAGIFVRVREEGYFRLGAARGCRPETSALRVDHDDPFVRWMEINAHLVCRSALPRIPELQDQLMLRRTLDALAAELIVPLHGRTRLLGWLFLGRQATGAPFEAADLQDIMQFAEHVATALENAMLYEEVAIQKTFAETLLHSIPTGIVAANQNGQIRWFNDAAEHILDLRREAVMGQPVEAIGSRIASRVRLALANDPSATAPIEWQEPLSHRYLSSRTARLTQGAECLGAVAFVHDQTQERRLQQKQKDLDRSAFWTELAANMSHEIRNPLVAIKAFAQLLPERYSDPDFRTEFSSIVTQEVDRLNAIIQQINTFANLPALNIEKISIKDAVLRGLGLARLRVNPNGVDIHTEIDEGLPPVRGDNRALAECFSHVIGNALEATKDRKLARVDIAAHTTAANGVPAGVEVVIHDNGGGIPAELLNNVFSPFCTGRGSGMGLGLPIAQRTLADHDGSIHIDTGNRGTTVTIALPTAGEDQESTLETPAHRR